MRVGFATSLLVVTFASASGASVRAQGASVPDSGPAPEAGAFSVDPALETPVSEPAQVADPVPSFAGVALDCPPDPVASAINGGSLDASDVGADIADLLRRARREGATVGEDGLPTHFGGLAGSWCRDANDPQCAPISPAPNTPAFGHGINLPDWLNSGFALGLEGPVAKAVAMRPVTDDFLIARGEGSIGHGRSLERPPRFV
jgi:hypothetical protein